jgi:hypothetical protein
VVRRLRSGRYRLTIPEEERAVIGALVGELRQLLAQEERDESLRRLFPPAYRDDAEADAEYHDLMDDDLLAGRLQSLEIVSTTLAEEELDEEQLLAWMGGLNNLRLVLGTRLDVSEETEIFDIDPADPNARALAVYGYLGWLLEHVVDALNG